MRGKNRRKKEKKTYHLSLVNVGGEWVWIEGGGRGSWFYVLDGGICHGRKGIIQVSENMLIFGYCKNCLEPSPSNRYTKLENLACFQTVFLQFTF